MVLDNLERPVDPRQERMREVVRHAPVTGIQAAGILTRLQVEGMDPARGTLHRWLAADEQAGLVRRGQYDANWRWTGASS
jgi:hypothetical protein